MRSLALLSSLAVAAVASVRMCNAQMAVKNGMTEDSHCGRDYCVTAVYTPSSKLVNYTLVVPQTTGWWAIGQGTQMVSANMAINWVNPDGKTVTTSHRTAGSHSEPVEKSATPSSLFASNNDVSGVRHGGMAVYSWMMSLPNGSAGKEAHIFATSPNAPSSTSTGATIRMHSRTEEDIDLDLSKPYKGAAPAGLAVNADATSGSISGGSTTPSKGSYSPNGNSGYGVMDNDAGGMRDLSNPTVRLFLAHMILMTMAWMGCFPLGILIARYGRSLLSACLPKHRAVQMFGLLMVVNGFFLAIGAVHSEHGDHFDCKHARLGLSLCILLLVQIALGMLAHVVRHRSGSRILGFVHMPLGILMIGLAVWTVNEGFKEWEWNAPDYARYIIFAWIACVGMVYLLGMLCCGRERRREREWHDRRFGAQDGVMADGIDGESGVHPYRQQQPHEMRRWDASNK